MKRRTTIVIVAAASAALIIWSLWPAIGCDGDVVQGIYRMVCVER